MERPSDIAGFGYARYVQQAAERPASSRAVAIGDVWSLRKALTGRACAASLALAVCVAAPAAAAVSGSRPVSYVGRFDGNPDAEYPRKLEPTNGRGSPLTFRLSRDRTRLTRLRLVLVVDCANHGGAADVVIRVLDQVAVHDRRFSVRIPAPPFRRGSTIKTGDVYDPGYIRLRGRFLHGMGEMRALATGAFSLKDPAYDSQGNLFMRHALCSNDGPGERLIARPR